MLKKTLALLLLLAGAAHAATYTIDDSIKIVGKEDTYKFAESGTTTMEYVASRHYQLGLSNMIEANPYADPIVPKNGTNLVIPGKVILPDTVRKRNNH